MKYALLVAQREYAENAKTKGFWIGILLFPVLITAVMKIMPMLDKATPTRHFVVVDQSDSFTGVLDTALERMYAQDLFRALGAYGKKHMDPDKAGEPVDLEDVPAGNMAEMMEEFAGDNPEIIDGFSKMGGLKLALAQMKPNLVASAPDFVEPRRRYQKVALPTDLDAGAALVDVAKALKPYLRGERKITVDGEQVDLFAAILIPGGVQDVVIRPGSTDHFTSKRSGVQYWASNLYDQDLPKTLRRVLNKEIQRLEYVDQGMDAKKVDTVQRLRLPFASLNPKKEEGKEEVSLADRIRQWAPVGFVYALYVSIMMIAQMLLNNTIEEKSNRIIEVLLSSVTARELMMGKMVGIAGIGITMVGTWLISLMVVLKAAAGPEAELATQLLGVLTTSNLLPAFGLYFFIGYTMYSGIFLAIGSVCNTLKDAQNMMGTVMMIMTVPILTMMFIPKDPHGTLATIMSWIPFYSPFAMMNRAAADPPMFDMVGTMVVMVVFTIFVLWFAGKIFRMGILRTGQPPRLIEMLRWVRS